METVEPLRSWLTGRLPADWFTAAPEVSVDRDEIVVVGVLAPPDTSAESTAEPSAAERGAAEQGAAENGRILAFREDTRDRRIAIARELEHRTGRKVAWGVECGDTRAMFTSIAAPVMTRLRQPERLVLDTLVESGVARSRADAVGWCVRLVQRNADDWLADLRTAMGKVEEVRAQGPDRA